MSAATLALDIGGTKIAFGLVADTASDTGPGTVVSEGRVPTLAHSGQICTQIVLAVQAAQEEAAAAGLEIVRVGAGAPGTVRPDDGVVVRAGPTIPGWTGTNVTALINAVPGLQRTPVAVHNDVRMWAWGEDHFGAGKDIHGRVLYLSLGTGLGGAVVDCGELLGGPTGSAGEFSELLVEDCRGLADRAENVVSGPALAAYYRALAAGEHTERIVWAAESDGQVTLREVMECYHEGEALAHKVIDGNLAGFGRAVGGLVSALDLSAVVLGGGVCGIGEPIIAPFTRALRDAALTPNRSIPVRTSTLGGNAPLVAAAAYARAQFPAT